MVYCDRCPTDRNELLGGVFAVVACSECERVKTEKVRNKVLKVCSVLTLMFLLTVVCVGIALAQVRGTFENKSGVLRADPNSAIAITVEYPMRAITVVGLDSLYDQLLAVPDSLVYRVFFLTDVPAVHTLASGTPNLAITSDSERYYWISRLAKELRLRKGHALVLNLDGSWEEFTGDDVMFWVERRVK